MAATWKQAFRVGLAISGKCRSEDGFGLLAPNGHRSKNLVDFMIRDAEDFRLYKQSRIKKSCVYDGTHH